MNFKDHKSISFKGNVDSQEMKKYLKVLYL